MKTVLANQNGRKQRQFLWKISPISMNLYNLFYKKIKNKSIHFFFLVFFTFFCCCFEVIGQYDPQISHNSQLPLLINSSYAGASGQANVMLLNRTQWVGIEGAPVTTVLGADMAANFLNNKGGVGLVLQNDEIGFFQNISIQALASQRYELMGDREIAIGLNLGIVNQSFDGSKVILRPSAGGDYHSETDPSIPLSKVEGFTFDMGLGVWYSGLNYYIGASVLHLLAPKPNFKDELNVYIPRTFFLTSGYRYKISERALELNPSAFVKYSRGSIQTDLNVNLRVYEKYWVGLGYRVQDAVIVLLGLELKSGIRFGYSYDITTSALSNAGSNGSHEIMVGYSFEIFREKRVKQYKSVRYL